MRTSGLFRLVVAVVALTAGTGIRLAQGRSSSDSIPLVAQYEFLGEPVVHGLSVHKKRGLDTTEHRLDAQLKLGSMIGDDSGHTMFHVEVRAFNTTYALLVEANTDLVHGAATMTRTAANGRRVQSSLATHDIGVFRGHVLRVGAVQPAERSLSLRRWAAALQPMSFDTNGSWARLAVFRDAAGRAVVDGAFSVGGETVYVKPAHTYMRTKRAADPALANPLARAAELRLAASIVYRQADLISEIKGASGGGRSCASDRLAGNISAGLPRTATARASLVRRSGVAFEGGAGAVQAGCPAARKILYMGAAADCSYVTAYQSQDGARQQILSDWNQASAVYERQLNVALGLVELQIEDLVCPAAPASGAAWNRACSEAYPIDRRLSDFSTWRAARGSDGCGLWHLMTNCPTGTEVGLAWLGTVCTTSASANTAQGGVSSGTGVSAVSRDEWKVVAHEVGHNFGATHDCTAHDCPCPAAGCKACCACDAACNCDARFIMNPTSPVTSDDFSPCSVRSMCAGIAAAQCLQAPGKRPTLSAGMCGNGIKEPGEECDCGTSAACADDPCCDAATCRLRPGAVCADANDACCDRCQLRAVGAVCRAAYSECDLREVCDGASPECPSDRHVRDGAACGNASGSALACASGQCTSRDAQCAARGGTEGLTRRCMLSMAGDLCDFQCASPNDPLTCMFMSGSFIDGTDCGFHARCRSGACRGENGFYQFLLLFQRNLAISVPVTVVVGLIVITVIVSLCCRCFACCRRMRPTKKSWKKNKKGPGALAPGAVLPLPPQSPFAQRPRAPPAWVDPLPYNGPDDGSLSHEMHRAGSQRSRLESPLTPPPPPPPDNYHYGRQIIGAYPLQEPPYHDHTERNSFPMHSLRPPPPERLDSIGNHMPTADNGGGGGGRHSRLSTTGRALSNSNNRRPPQ